jgi:hypothetical protein
MHSVHQGKEAWGLHGISRVLAMSQCHSCCTHPHMCIQRALAYVCLVKLGTL